MCPSRAIRLLTLVLALAACRSSNGNLHIGDAEMGLLLLPILLPIAVISALDDDEDAKAPVEGVNPPPTPNADGGSDAALFESAALHGDFESRPDCAAEVDPACRKRLVKYFEQRRREIEGRWAKIIHGRRQFHCRPQQTSAEICKRIVASAEVERDAELRLLDEEQQRVLAGG